MESKGNIGRSRSSSTLAGAVFMCNSLTMKDSFNRQLFGLPSNVWFLKKIRVGTILFLFEYQERKLYGVFEATCDGALNIIPHAFSSSRNFSAQVRFKTRWQCHPLIENEFYPAIKENYYTQKKFHLDLSGKQVLKLMDLFVKKMKGIKKRSLGIEISSPARFDLNMNQCLVSPQKKKKKHIDTLSHQEFSHHKYPKRFNKSFLGIDDDSFSVIPEEEFILPEAQTSHSFMTNDLGSHLQDTCHLHNNMTPGFPCVHPSAISSRDLIVEVPSRKCLCPSHLDSGNMPSTDYLPMVDSNTCYTSKADMGLHPLQNLSSSYLSVSNTDAGNYYGQTIYDSYVPSTLGTLAKAENFASRQEDTLVLEDGVLHNSENYSGAFQFDDNSRRSQYWEIGQDHLEEFQFEDNSQRSRYWEFNHDNSREFHFEDDPRRLRYWETKHDMSREFQLEDNPRRSRYRETEPYNSKEFLFDGNYDMKMESDVTIPLKDSDCEKLLHMYSSRHDQKRRAIDVKKIQKSEDMRRQKASVFSRLSNAKNANRVEEDLVMTCGDFSVGRSVPCVSKQKNKLEKTDGDFSVDQSMLHVAEQKIKLEKTNGDVSVDQSMFHVAVQKYKLEKTDGDFSVDQSKSRVAEQKDKLAETSGNFSVSRSLPWVVEQKKKSEQTDNDFSRSATCVVNQKNKLEKTDCNLSVDRSTHCVAKKKYKLENTDGVFSVNQSMSCVAKQKIKLKKVGEYGCLTTSLAKQVHFFGHLEPSEDFNFKRRSKMCKVNEGEEVNAVESSSGKQKRRKLTRPSFCYDSCENDSSRNQYGQHMNEHILGAETSLSHVCENKDENAVECSQGKQKRRKLTRPSFCYDSCENDSSRNQSGQLMDDHILGAETSIDHVCENKDENTNTRNQDGQSMRQEDVLGNKYFVQKAGAEKDFGQVCEKQDENANNRINKFWASNVLLGAETYFGQVCENNDENANNKNQDRQLMDSQMLGKDCLFHKVGAETKMDKDENTNRSSQTGQSMDPQILGMKCSFKSADAETGFGQVCVNKDENANCRNQDGQPMDQQILDRKRPFDDIACAETGFGQVCEKKDENANSYNQNGQTLDQEILGTKCSFDNAGAETCIGQVCEKKDENANSNNQNGQTLDQEILGMKCSLDNAGAEACIGQVWENKDGKANSRNQDGQLMDQQILGKRSIEKTSAEADFGQVCEEKDENSNSKNQDGQLIDQHILAKRWANCGSTYIINRPQVGKSNLDKAVAEMDFGCFCEAMDEGNDCNNYVTEGSSQKLVQETSKLSEKCEGQAEEIFAGISSSCKKDGFQCELLGEGELRCDETLEESELRCCDETLEEGELRCEPLEGLFQSQSETHGFIEISEERGSSADIIKPALACINLPDYRRNLVDTCNTSSFVANADAVIGIQAKNKIKEEVCAELDCFDAAQRSIWNLYDKKKELRGMTCINRTGLLIESRPSYCGYDDSFVSVGGRKEVKEEEEEDYRDFIKPCEKNGNEIALMRDSLNYNFLGTKMLAKDDCVDEGEQV